MARDFFKLEGTVQDIDQLEFHRLAEASAVEIRDYIYRPDRLTPTNGDQRRVSEKVFINVSFSKTDIEDIEFFKCIFKRCLFMSTTFRRCRFTLCEFVDSNPHRLKLDAVFIDPTSFEKSLDKNKHQNIGLHLYHELLMNSRKQSQPEFSEYSLYNFRLWGRRQKLFELRKKSVPIKLRGIIGIVPDYISQLAIGYGVRLRNFSITIISSLLLISYANWFFRDNFGLTRSSTPIESYVDALYFTVITLTTLGFGDIVPTSGLGKLIVGAEAILGFVLLASLASLVFKKIAP